MVSKKRTHGFVNLKFGFCRDHSAGSRAKFRRSDHPINPVISLQHIQNTLL
jgi:hypothetical protein